MDYPSTIDSFTTKENDVNDVLAADVNNLQAAVVALQTKVGVDNSAVETTIEYKVAAKENSSNKVTSLSAGSTDVQYPSAKLVYDQLAGKQASLVSGTNIKTINSTSLLGSGDIAITVPVKATGAEIDTGTDDVKFATAKAIADQTVLLKKSGGIMTGDITLGENASIALDPAGSADGKYTGITVAGTAGETVAFGDLMYLKAADSKWWLTDADATETGGAVMVGMCVVGGNANDAIKILLLGIIRADAKFPALTIGAPVYVGETAGAIQVEIPTGADNVIRVVGFALTADEIYFNPSQDHQITVA